MLTQVCRTHNDHLLLVTTIIISSTILKLSQICTVSDGRLKLRDDRDWEHLISTREKGHVSRRREMVQAEVQQWEDKI